MKRLMIVLFAAGLALMQGVQAANPKENQKDVAARIALDGDRAVNRGDEEGAKEAKSASMKARHAKTVEQARQIEKNYNKDNFN